MPLPKVGLSVCVKIPLQMVPQTPNILRTFCFVMSEIVSKHLAQDVCPVPFLTVSFGCQVMPKDIVDVLCRSLQRSFNRALHSGNR